MLSQAIPNVCTAALFLAWEPQTSFFFLRTTRLPFVGLMNEINTKRIHIEENIWGNFSSGELFHSLSCAALDDFLVSFIFES